MTGYMIMDYSLLILFLPLAAFLIQIFIGKRLPRQGDWVAIGAVVTTLILSIAMFTSMLIGHEPHFAQEASFTWLRLTSAMFIILAGGSILGGAPPLS